MKLIKKMRNKKFTKFISVFFANAVPLYGVIFVQQSLFYTLILYWIENIVIAFYTVNKILISPNEFSFRIKSSQDGQSPFVGKAGIEKVSQVISIFNKTQKSSKSSMATFFIITFCIYSILHLFLLLSLFDFSDFSFTGLWIGTISFFVSHGLAYYFIFKEQGWYKRVTIKETMFQADKRIITMFLLLFIGGLIYKLFLSERVVLIIAILIKLVIDLIFINKEFPELKVTDHVIEVRR